ncbi:hypothetical protein [Streptococcus suis]|uniref:hypothetical protein n=1 Tax=Streptococcus suis TaxID=1307 RepID=UPI000400B765|nr:hypothetical protein [Streptococcus suis]HEM3230678.1 hypothetical protein [Streptococcus suis 2726]HEM4075355.1 hypothetical protein [Streptococcus suis]
MNQKYTGFVYGVDASSMFAQAMALLQKGMVATGAFLVVMGIINLSTNIKDGGPGVRNAILEIVGGVMVGAAGAFITQITI